jgi:hypothetical protein
VIPQVGDLVQFPLKLERVAKRGRTQTVSKKKVVTVAMGTIASAPVDGRYVIRLLAVKKIRCSGWHGFDELTFEEILVDDVDLY